jgi:hypothetical protein
MKEGSLSSIASAYFTVSGFDLIADSLEKCGSFRLLLGSEPGSDPMRMLIMDVWRNIDLRQSSLKAQRAVQFFLRDNVSVRLHQETFFHGKTYILNHPEPKFTGVLSNGVGPSATSKRDSASGVESISERSRPTKLTYAGARTSADDRPLSLVGSSNLTYGGLFQNAELNLLDLSGETTIELLTWFEERWQHSRDIKSEFVSMLQGYFRPFAPFWIYAKALWELYKDDLFGTEVGKPTTQIELADFQIAGYRAARRILQKWNGVLIADAPGLGKTYIAGRIWEDYAYHEREPTLIICPAEVEQIWNRFAEKQRIPKPRILHTEVLGRGMREGNPEKQVEDYKDCSLIIVDESHHFRNPDAGRFIWLQRLFSLPAPQIKVAGKSVSVDRKVIFVTATPVNNSVWDLYSQLQLLYGPRLREIAARQGITDIPEYFGDAQEGAGNLYDLIEAIAVRRSRTFIRQYYPDASLEGVRVKFPERELHRIEYSMNPSLSSLHVRARIAIESAKLVPYRIEAYRIGLRDDVKVIRGDLLSTLFRVLLLKRLESSLIAFRITLQNIIRLFEASYEMLSQGNVFRAENIREYLHALATSGEDQEILEPPANADLAETGEFDIETMKNDLKNDIDSLRAVLEMIPGDAENLARMDAKLQEVKKRLEGAPTKTIIFTTFVDTANYLFRHLKDQGRVVALVTGDDARIWDGADERGIDRGKIINLFSPRSNEYTLRQNEKEVQLVIATDVLSEAINLQDAEAVLNYDFPWNPMKLVQRAGRIDRIGSIHDKISISNVFPDKGLESILQLMQKLLGKIAQAHRSVGLEWSLLGEEPVQMDFAETFERIRAGDKGVLIDIEKQMEGLVGLDPQEQLLAILQTLSKEELEKIPDGAGSLTKLQGQPKNRQKGVFVAYRRRRGPEDVDKVWRFYPAEKLQGISNKTEIIEQIQFPMTHSPEQKFGEESLRRLHTARTNLEGELRAIDARQRTLRITGPVRRAFDLVKLRGRGDLDKFLQESWQQPAVQREIRKIDFSQEDEALNRLEKLAGTFGREERATVPTPAKISREVPPASTDPTEKELPQIPSEHDPSLELVCWMHII